MKNKIQILNKKASHDYEFIEKYTAGIVLMGPEIKSIRNGKASIADSYCVFRNGELWVKNMHIAEYENRGYVSLDPGRERKLLLHATEMRKLKKKIKERGFTLVATRLYIAENGYAKLNIALARGKKQYDKREDLKRKDMGRQMERMQKY
jgi:SsrA-binding protein